MNLNSIISFYKTYFLCVNSKFYFTGFYTLASITPSKSVTTKEAISRFSPENRECYVDGEYDMEYLQKSLGYRYSIRNCLFDIVIADTVKNCNCYFPINYLVNNNIQVIKQ